MSLKGNLTDFDLSYIIQIISQESKTGILTVTAKNHMGYIVFRQGKIISADTSEETIEEILMKYCVLYKKFSEHEIHELFDLCKKNLHAFSSELTTKKYLEDFELNQLAILSLEDIACSVFFWKQGTYEFTTHQNVDRYQIDSIALGYDALAMEAARRSDEIPRIKKAIAPTTIFAPTQQRQLYGSTNVFENISEFLLSYIDGKTTVKELWEQTFFSAFRIYETLFTLIQSNKIIPINKEEAPSQTQKNPVQVDTTSSKIFVSLFVTCFICLIFSISGYLMNNFLFATAWKQREVRISELSHQKTYQLITISTLLFESLNGTPPESFDQLIADTLITQHDINSFVKTSKNVSESFTH